MVSPSCFPHDLSRRLPVVGAPGKMWHEVGPVCYLSTTTQEDEEHMADDTIMVNVEVHADSWAEFNEAVSITGARQTLCLDRALSLFAEEVHAFLREHDPDAMSAVDKIVELRDRYQRREPTP